ncbi:MAG: SUF system NifU family Fe-S cluster assembly protein [Spirochaetaceae bacterium]|nr:MAG: SUF system NifU family Fe-S cluster assembly protein [Spirochaetaceae bacterium]
MSLEEDIYKEIILDNYRSRKNRMRLEDADLHSEGANPSCGDDVELFIKLSGDTIEAVSYEGIGCSICCASANLLCESLRGRSLAEAQQIILQYRDMLLEDGEPEFAEEISDLEAMQGVKNYPVRIKCALLAWNTVRDMLQNSAGGGQGG